MGPLLFGAMGCAFALWATNRIESELPGKSLLDTAHLVLYVALLAVAVALVGVPLALRRGLSNQAQLLARVTPHLRSHVSLESLNTKALSDLEADLHRLEDLLLHFPDNSTADAKSLALVRSALARVVTARSQT